MAHGKRVSVGTTATRLSNVPTLGDGNRATFSGVTLQNIGGAASVFVGGSDVSTSSYGLEVAVGATVILPTHNALDLYAVVASGSINLNVLHY